MTELKFPAEVKYTEKSKVVTYLDSSITAGDHRQKVVKLSTTEGAKFLLLRHILKQNVKCYIVANSMFDATDIYNYLYPNLGRSKVHYTPSLKGDSSKADVFINIRGKMKDVHPTTKHPDIKAVHWFWCTPFECDNPDSFYEYIWTTQPYTPIPRFSGKEALVSYSNQQIQSNLAWTLIARSGFVETKGFYDASQSKAIHSVYHTIVKPTTVKCSKCQRSCEKPITYLGRHKNLLLCVKCIDTYNDKHLIACCGKYAAGNRLAPFYPIIEAGHYRCGTDAKVTTCGRTITECTAGKHPLADGTTLCQRCMILRCWTCRKSTNRRCSTCQVYFCKNHVDPEGYCLRCHQSVLSLREAKLARLAEELGANVSRRDYLDAR